MSAPSNDVAVAEVVELEPPATPAQPTFASCIEGEPILSVTKAGVILTANCIVSHVHNAPTVTSHKSSINLSTFIGNNDGHLIWCSADFHLSAFQIYLQEGFWLVATLRTVNGDYLESRLDLNEGLRVEEGEMVFVCPHDDVDDDGEESQDQDGSESEPSSPALVVGEEEEEEEEEVSASDGGSSIHSPPTSERQLENQTDATLDPASTPPSLHDALLDLTSTIVSTGIAYFRSLNHLLNSSITSTSTPSPNNTDTDTDIDSNTPLDWTPFIEKDTTLFLGGGRFGDVYKGSWTNIPSAPSESSVQSRFPQVVVKVIRPLTINERDKNARRAFKYLQREIAVWQRLEHENIVPFLGISRRFGPVPSLISVWMANGSANEYLLKNPEADRIVIIRGIARGLKYLHSHDPEICHGDLKAANILISSTGSACISDFGLSRIIDETTTLWSTTTSTNASGSIRWMAPELISGDQLTVHKPGDVYAYAMTCLEIMTDKLPFAKYTNDGAVMYAVMFKKERPTRPTLGEGDLEVKTEDDNTSSPISSFSNQTESSPKRVTGARPIISDSLWGVWEECWNEDAKERLGVVEVVKRMEEVWEEYNVI